MSQEVRIPFPFIAQKDGLYKVIERKDGNINKYISRNVPLIHAKYRDVEFNHIYYEIHFKSDGKLIKTIEPASAIAKKSILLDLAFKDLNINDNNAKDFIDYFSLFEKENEIVIRNTVTRLGYINGEFYHNNNSSLEITTENNAYKRILDAIHTKGSLEDYQRNVFNKVKGSKVASFMMYASLASILLDEFKVEPFVIDIAGSTSTGKTTVLKLAASVWGKYDDLVHSWNVTEVGIERLATITNSFPLILDDTQKANYQNIIKSIYQFTTGSSRVRGSIEGIKNNYKWSNIMFSSGEHSIVNHKGNAGGASARVITVSRTPFEKIDFREIYEGLNKYYGTLGLAFQKEYEQYKEYYQHLYNVIYESYCEQYTLNDVLSRLVRLMSIIHLSGFILDRIDGFESNVTEICNTIFEDIIEENKTVNMPELKLNEILSVLDTKRNTIQSNENQLLIHEVNAVNREDFIGVTKNFLKTIFEPYEIQQIIKEWGIEKYLVTDKDRVQKSVKIRTAEGKYERIRVYAIKKEVINSLGYDFEIYSK